MKIGRRSQSLRTPAEVFGPAILACRPTLPGL